MRKQSNRRQLLSKSYRDYFLVTTSRLSHLHRADRLRCICGLQAGDIAAQILVL
jgi:hypothetical protein